MNVVLFGATGMVGAGVLLECFADPRVTSVLVITAHQPDGVTPSCVKSSTRISSTLSRSAQTSPGATPVSSVSASSLGLSEVAYTRVTYDIAMAAAREMVAANPRMTFCFVSGVGTDSTEKGRTMWARVKGKTENALLALGFKAAHMFRPGYIQPIGDVQSKTGWVQTAYHPATLPADSSPAAEQLDDDLEPWPRHDSGRRNGYSNTCYAQQTSTPWRKDDDRDSPVSVRARRTAERVRWRV